MKLQIPTYPRMIIDSMVHEILLILWFTITFRATEEHEVKYWSCGPWVIVLFDINKIHLEESRIKSHLSTAVAWREKKYKHFVFYKYFSLVLGLLKSKISEKINQLLLNKLDFKLFHYKARVQLVRKITTIATRNRC